MLFLAIRARAAADDAIDDAADRLRSDTGAIAIEYVIVAVALLAIAGAIAAALTALGNDAVQQLPSTVSDTGG